MHSCPELVEIPPLPLGKLLQLLYQFYENSSKLNANYTSLQKQGLFMISFSMIITCNPKYFIYIVKLMLLKPLLEL